MITLFLYAVLGLASAMAQTSTSPSSTPAPAMQTPQQETATKPRLTPSEIADLKAKAEAGDPSAQEKLGKAYQDGDGIPQNDDLAWKWYRKAADQGDAAAENNLGIMYRLGEGPRQRRSGALVLEGGKARQR